MNVRQMSTIRREQGGDMKRLCCGTAAAMIAIMGFLVGGIVLAVFLPIFKLQAALSK